MYHDTKILRYDVYHIEYIYSTYRLITQLHWCIWKSYVLGCMNGYVPQVYFAVAMFVSNRVYSAITGTWCTFLLTLNGHNNVHIILLLLLHQFYRCSKQEMSSLVLWLLVTLMSSLAASQYTSSDGIVMTEVTSITPLTIGMFIMLLLIFLEHTIRRRQNLCLTL